VTIVRRYFTSIHSDSNENVLIMLDKLLHENSLLNMRLNKLEKRVKEQKIKQVNSYIY